MTMIMLHDSDFLIRGNRTMYLINNKTYLTMTVINHTTQNTCDMASFFFITHVQVLIFRTEVIPCISPDPIFILKPHFECRCTRKLFGITPSTDTSKSICKVGVVTVVLQLPLARFVTLNHR